MKVTGMTGRSRSVKRFGLVPLAGLAAICVETASLAQGSDRTKPPPILKSVGEFRAAPLSRPPLIDGREWIAANVQTTSSPGTVPVPTQAFSLTMRDCGDHGGDFDRCQLLFQRGRGTPVRIDAGFTGWVLVTLNGHYVVTEPLSYSTCASGSSTRCSKRCKSRTTRKLRRSRATASVSSSREETARSIAKMCVSNITSSFCRKGRTAVDPL